MFDKLFKKLLIENSNSPCLRAKSMSKGQILAQKILFKNHHFGPNLILKIHFYKHESQFGISLKNPQRLENSF